jgi:hypothetical protein
MINRNAKAIATAVIATTLAKTSLLKREAPLQEGSLRLDADRGLTYPQSGVVASFFRDVVRLEAA